MARKLLQGIIVPTITPLTPDEELDVAALERLAGRLLGAEVHGLFVAGTTGEGPALSIEMRRELITRLSSLVGGRMPVVMAALESAPAETMRMIGYAADAGAAAVAIAPPYYMPPSQPDLLRYVRRVARSSPLPVYLYNVPNPALPRFPLATLAQLVEEDNIRGFKDSGGSREFLLAAIRLFEGRPESSVLAGPESLIVDCVRAGGDGGVSGGANLFPELYTRLYRASVRCDWRSAETLLGLVLRVDREFYHAGEGEASLIRGVKAAASLMGICGETLASPHAAATREEITAIGQRLGCFERDLNEVLRAPLVPGSADPPQVR